MQSSSISTAIVCGFMTVSLGPALARAGSAERIDRLIATEVDAEKAALICVRVEAVTSTDAALRELCARAVFTATKPESEAELLAFRDGWAGTATANEAYLLAALGSRPPELATVDTLLAHHARYRDTEVGRESSQRADDAFFQQASDVGSEAAMSAYAAAWPVGRHVREARAAAFTFAKDEADTVEAFVGLRARYPDQTPQIDDRARAWMLARWADRSGPCFTEPCRLDEGEVLRISGPVVEGLLPPTVRLVLLDQGRVVDDFDLLIAALGALDWLALLEVREDGPDWIWTAPFDWAVPPLSTGLAWGVELVVPERGSQVLPLLLSDRWQGRGEQPLTWSAAGVVEWNDGNPRTLLEDPYDRLANLVVSWQDVWLLARGRLVHIDRLDGSRWERTVSGDHLSLAGIGRVLVRDGARRSLCDEDICVEVPVGRIFAPIGRSIERVGTKIVVREVNGIELSSFPAGDEAALDAYGNVVAVRQGSEVRFHFADSGKILGTHSIAEPVVRDLEPAGYSGGFLVRAIACVECYDSDDAEGAAVLIDTLVGATPRIRATVVGPDIASFARRGTRILPGLNDGVLVQRSGDRVRAVLQSGQRLIPVLDADIPVPQNEVDANDDFCFANDEGWSWTLPGSRYTWVAIQAVECVGQLGEQLRGPAWMGLVDTRTQEVHPTQPWLSWESQTGAALDRVLVHEPSQEYRAKVTLFLPDGSAVPLGSPENVRWVPTVPRRRVRLVEHVPRQE